MRISSPQSGIWVNAKHDRLHAELALGVPRRLAGTASPYLFLPHTKARKVLFPFFERILFGVHIGIVTINFSLFIYFLYFVLIAPQKKSNILIHS